jgi:hypothetical protein
MDPVISLAVAGGAIVLGGKALSSEKKPTVAAPTTSGATLKKTTVSYASTLNAVNLIQARASTFLNSVPGGAHSSDLEQKILAKAKSEWDKLSKEAKAAACKKLKAAYPNNTQIQNIDCSAGNFQAILQATAGAAGTAACVASGAGAAVSPLCGAAAAFIAGYVGPKLEEWTKDAYNKVGEWAEDGYNAAKGAVKDAIVSGFGLW